MTTRRTLLVSARARALLAAVAAVAAACSSGPPTVGARLASPASVVAFSGVTTKDPTNAKHPYLAVASARGDELRIVDLLDDQPVVGPAKVFPLSVITAPKPLLVAAAPLGDGATGAPDTGSDLLVAASAGQPALLQVVETWDVENRIAFSVALDALLPASDEAISIAAVTLPAGARVLLGTSSGNLIVVDFQRAPDGVAIVRSAAAPAAQALGFAPLDLAVEPLPEATGANRVFAATRDPLAGGVQGVAQIQMVPAAGGWAVTPLDARSPTRAVAVAAVAERTAADAGVFDPATAQLRVYAVLDPAGCGPDMPMACGVATLLPPPRLAGRTNDLAPDPANPADPLSFRPPMLVPGVGDALAIVGPPANGNSTERVLDPATGVPLLYVQPTTGRSTTSAAAAVSSSDGHVYLLDLGRYAPLNDVNPLQGANRAWVTSTSTTPGPTIGVWTDFPAGTGGADVAITTAPAQIPSHLQITPGITPADTFTVGWKIPLSTSLTSRQGLLYTTGGVSYVAIQTGAGPDAVVGARVADPALGIRGGGEGAGDLVELPCADPPQPPRTDSYSSVQAVLPPNTAVGLATFPGGALRLAAAACAGTVPAEQPTPVTVTVRAAKLVLTGAALGYVGRPQFDAPYLEFQWDPAVDVPAAPPSEALSRVRKARRIYYPAFGPCAAGTWCASYPWLVDPVQPGPALAFRLGVANAASEASLPVGAALTIVTQAGIAPTSRVPTTGGAAPVKPVPFDRSTYQDPKTLAFPNVNDPVRFYAPFLDDQILDLSPSRTQAEVIVIR